MAASYCLIGVLVLAVVANGQEVGTGDLFCTGCEKTIETLKTFMTSPAAQAEAQNIAEVVCNIIPYEYNAECEAFAKEFPAFVQLFAEEYLDPKIDCQAFCPANQVTFYTAVGKLASGLPCVACEKYVGMLKNATLDADVLAEVVKVMEETCRFAPYMYYQTCMGLVKEIPAVAKFIADEYLDPVKDCALFCNAPALIVQKDAPEANANLFKMFQSMKVKN